MPCTSHRLKICEYIQRSDPARSNSENKICMKAWHLQPMVFVWIWVRFLCWTVGRLNYILQPEDKYIAARANGANRSGRSHIWQHVWKSLAALWIKGWTWVRNRKCWVWKTFPVFLGFLSSPKNFTSFRSFETDLDIFRNFNVLFYSLIGFSVF